MDTPVSGTPRLLLRIEGMTLLVVAVVAYYAIGGSWAMFALLLLAPDLGMIGYAAGPRVGAMTYNALHLYLGPAALAAVGYFGQVQAAWPLALIWLAHIGMDRALGFGLKFSTAFRATHLGST